MERCVLQRYELQVRGDLLEHRALGLGADESSHDFAVLEAVSYTHLDVYKRQIDLSYLTRIAAKEGIDLS